MEKTGTVNKKAVFINRVKTFLSNPTKMILLLFGITCTISAIAPIIAIVEDTFKVHLGTIDQYLSG